MRKKNLRITGQKFMKEVKKVPADKKYRVLTYILSLIILLFSITNLSAQDGAKLFKSNCASCHKVEGKLVGPQLKGSLERTPGKDWIIKWVKNSQALIESGDEYANKIFDEYNKSVMPAHPQLSDEDILAIVDYAESYAPPKESTSSGSVAGEGLAQAQESAIDNPWVLVGLALLLVVIALFLSRVIGVLTNVAVEKNPEAVNVLPKVIPLNQRAKNFARHKLTIAVIVIVGLIFLGRATWDGATSLGRQQGYQPEQPIKFSHQLHAGLNKIDCKYCHVGAERGKTAVIPSLNICMNCHKAVQEGPQYGKEEITKIYTAIGWDPEKQQYIENYQQKSIKWIKIHNLPDHVYFNHSQHVKVGGVECQTCHGPIEEMEVVKQFAPLSMGWCIQCHRETEVQFTNNNYYNNYEEIHQQLKEGKIDKVTVEKIGGTECQRCHY